MLPMSIPEAITSLMLIYLRKQVSGRLFLKRPYLFPTNTSLISTSEKETALHSFPNAHRRSLRIQLHYPINDKPFSVQPELLRFVLQCMRMKMCSRSSRIPFAR